MADRKKAVKAAIDFSIEGAKKPAEKKAAAKKPAVKKYGTKFSEPKGSAEPKKVSEANSKVQAVVKKTGLTPAASAAKARVRGAQITGDARRASSAKQAATPSDRVVRPARTAEEKTKARVAMQAKEIIEGMQNKTLKKQLLRRRSK